MSGRTYDIVGIGFGPSGLALAIAREEYGHAAASAVFVEARKRFAWHPGMMVEGATMQVPFPKDLVTLRNPSSPYSFFSYLHEHGRLVDFVNRQTFFCSRREFADYLAWAAARVDTPVHYGTRAVAVRATAGGAELEVELSTGERLVARNVVVSAGLRPALPEGVVETSRRFHNNALLPRLAELPRPRHRRFVVLGAGQSAAECVRHLHRIHPDAEVHSVISRYGYLPADDSPFANRVFDPLAVDEFHAAPESERRRLLAAHRSTNYSCVDPDLLRELYDIEYEERVSGRRRLFVRRASALESAVETADGVRAILADRLTGAVDALDCDAVIYATGFRPADLRPLFGDLIAEYTPDGQAATIARDYRVRTTAAVTAGIYVQGGCEHTHGLSSSLLSNVAVRAGEILDSVLARRSVAVGR
ncbi:lysine N(6)-hydroxylase/L-ornithine N(5)-oxygenase family protein [Nocardia sp. CDC159]|uniref:L-lysine N6-monooxygenase MbtG n=1 Tax=Nocardia pulmonis TaxID=2951408 RepID=A0A9X2ITM4_9NOCA|nr:MULTISPECIES: SidA/IucD/PvdA family monooxygenase [Nocardia]MCM6771952.1 lysine N(6)-hydroxylase/L-ornithine N(5)-oxygenase family protein [Nocardia pulmonis]MCM6785390.1 lysine N(6)-hydroxylase/L-ornithine N(5)-oxygenase family protein [Nocardia sp. CDC159]